MSSAFDFRRLSYWVACVGGLGLAPRAPGTVGTLAAVALYYLTFAWPFWLCALAWLALVIVAGVCIHASLPLFASFSSHDPSAVVIDEVVGALVAFAFLPAGWYWMVLAFAAFRFFDIVKPWPIAWLDANVRGASGIILDDLLAGVYALATVQMTHAIFHGFV